MSEQNPVPASAKSAAIETVVNGFLTYPGFSDQDRQGRIVWLSVLQEGARDWEFEDWHAFESVTKARLQKNPSYGMIMGVIGSKLIITAATEVTVEKSAA